MASRSYRSFVLLVLAGILFGGEALASPTNSDPDLKSRNGARGSLIVEFLKPQGNVVEGQGVRVYIDNAPVGSFGPEDVKTDIGCRTDASGTCQINGLLRGTYAVAHESNCCGATVGGVEFVEIRHPRKAASVTFIVPSPPG